MAFSDDTRNELARVVPAARCCRVAELSAFYDLDGMLMGNAKQYLDFTTSAPVVARKVLTLLRSLYPEISTQILVRRSRSRRTQICTVRVLQTKEAQAVYGEMKEQRYTAKGEYLRKKCCRRAYLRGAFLGHGSITNPERTYHLEFSTDHSQAAARILSTIHSFHLAAGVTQRKGSLVVYLKDGEEIVTLLNLMGAHQALLQFENVRVLKEMRNQVNRLVNCETANVDKTIKAAMAQVEDIQLIEKHIGLDELPPKLRQVAKLRLENPYASLKELGDMCVPPMSKSGINYRIRQLREKAAEIARLYQ
ncbi:MAG: DNA-binding protein WhiA [Firmicutes bacterium]|jgi:DNA-binding protein WhiA|nr:DNA-binding protein WhiA [Bacillota bacterium]